MSSLHILLLEIDILHLYQGHLLLALFFLKGHEQVSYLCDFFHLISSPDKNGWSVNSSQRPRGATGRDCPFCAKSFRSSHHLKVHLRVHTGKKVAKFSIVFTFYYHTVCTFFILFLLDKLHFHIKYSCKLIVSYI